MLQTFAQKKNSQSLEWEFMYYPGVNWAYFRPVETDVKVVDKLVPTAVTAPMITTAISAAIRPYSMAVAPLSFFAKRANADI